METQDGTELAAEAVSQEAVEAVSAPGPEATAGETPAQSTGINPAWTPLQEALGEDYFQTHAVPVLKSMDEAANSRITSLNSQLKAFEPYKPLVEQGLDVEQIQMAMQIRDALENDPRQVYEFLKSQFGEEEAQAAAEGLEAYGAEQEDALQLPPAAQARLEQLEAAQRQQLEMQQQQQQEQEFQRQLAIESEQLDREMDDFLANTPGFSESDKGELYQIRHELTQRLAAQGLSRLATMQEVNAEFNRRLEIYKSRFAGAAPSTLPTTSGGSVTPTSVDTKKLSKTQMADLIAADLAAANKAS